MVETVINATGFDGGTAIVLGSGLGEFADQLEEKKLIAYDKIAGYPISTVPGHAGEFVSGKLSGQPILAAKGRFHFYEGYKWDTVVLPIKLFHQLNVKTVILTNSSGSMRTSINPGSLVLIKGYMDCTFRENPKDPKIVSIEQNFNPNLKHVSENASADDIHLKEGIYCWTLGPMYETPAEISYFRSLGGDVVGMSTVPEIIEAKKLGMNVLGISCATNYAAGMSDTPLNHEEVLETAEKTKGDFIKLLKIVIKNIED